MGGKKERGKKRVHGGMEEERARWEKEERW